MEYGVFKVPPEIAERNVLGAMLISQGQAIPEMLPFIGADDTAFANESYGRIWKTAVQMYQNAGTIDVTSLLPVAREEVLAEIIAAVPTSNHAAMYAEQVSQHYTKRTIASYLSTIRNAEQADLEYLSERIAAMQDIITHHAAARDIWRPMDMSFILSETPPEREWIFKDAIGRGDLCGIAAEGGSGKTFLALIMAISLASGRVLLDCFKPLGAHRALLLAGEDQELIIWQRIHAIVHEFQLSPSERTRLIENLHVFAGQSEPLTAISNIGLVRTARWEWLRRHIDVTDPAFIILDPKSRWDGAMNENDAAQSTGFITAVQDLIGDQRAGLILHHVAKQNGQDADSSAARGSTALRDGCRWFANITRMTEKQAKDFNIEGEESKYIRLTITKSNYTAHMPEPVYLQRSDRGVLTVAHLATHKRDNEALLLVAWLTNLGHSVYHRDFMRGTGDDYKAFKEYSGLARKDIRDAADAAVRTGQIKLKDEQGKQVMVC